MTIQDGMTFDYIIVGAGSAGCVLAARLTEDPDCRVLLLEAGGTDQHPEVQDPVKWTTLFPGELDWGYSTTPLKSCHNRVDHVPRAKMLGGCHSHNASVWVRGHHTDFDHWAYQGCDGWAWQDVLPIFRRIEDWQGPACDLRGTGGPIHVVPPIDPHPVAAALVESGPSAGLPVISDCNGPAMEGTTFFNLSVKDGRRFTVADGYLRPAMHRENLTVLTEAVTQRLLLDGTHCTGVEFLQGGKIQSARASREVILSAGVIGSPVILMHSGIGPAAELESIGISAVHDLSGVGRNLQDHPLCAGINYEAKGTLPAPRNNGAESTLFWRSRSGLIGPDIQPVLLEFPFATPQHADKLPSDNCYAIAPSVIRPASRGSVRLVSADPLVAPAIDVNYMACDADINAMLAAIDLCRELGASEAFADLRKREVMPGPLGRKEMIDFVRDGATTYFHPTSTCKMGIDEESVVDPQLKVYGIEGLRIADASIMPQVTSGNTNAPSIMIGERCSDLIRGHSSTD